jgi:hypothetical protein
MFIYPSFICVLLSHYFFSSVPEFRYNILKVALALKGHPRLGGKAECVNIFGVSDCYSCRGHFILCPVVFADFAQMLIVKKDAALSE